MANGGCTIKVVEHSQVSPPPGSVPVTSVPLSFFDLPWLLCRPMQRLFFYHLPYSTLHFTHSILPSLKASLSATLQIFYPFAAKLICPSSPQKPHILYTDGDSISFIVAESLADFDRTTGYGGYHVRDVKDLHPFVPELPHASAVSNTRVSPLLALQVTVFPNVGISIGATFCHVLADGRSFNHFMKSWASFFRSAAGNSATVMPLLGRSVIQEKDPCGLESVLLNGWLSCASNQEDDKEQVQRDVFADKVRATFVIDRAGIQKLKRRVLDRCIEKCEAELPRASTFVVACAQVWTCLIKAQQLSGSLRNQQDADEFYYFCFPADCRNRPELAIPATYFGNCLAICFVQVTGNELVGEDGLVAATKAIGNRVEEFEKGALRGAEKWISNWIEISESGRLLVMAGSPKLRVYDTDFGWGRPKKTEVVHVDASPSIYIGDSRDEEGGIEIGLALKRYEMDAFIGCFEQGFNTI
ncbi:putative r2r3-myb transcription factor [Hibiscus syriacus]|uniref:R2r3-myb transcription factor n=1 Tax=Hibiscus syriacus TaxID=106335 RepID=A0A6A3D233_HIBSY|nr:anthocyanin 5-aromatic acyltransferase-like [Hibiscus syriacus]KAE8733858.1 putative r2r3-myb transcription factor [Hibiscus syriacus]